MFNVVLLFVAGGVAVQWVLIGLQRSEGALSSDE